MTENRPLIHCPKDCSKGTTCYRGQPLPYDKRVCYVPDSNLIVDIMNTIKEYAEKYKYYYDEEESEIKRLDNTGGLINIDDFRNAGISYWSNERLVIPLEFVRMILREKIKGE